MTTTSLQSSWINTLDNYILRNKIISSLNLNASASIDEEVSLYHFLISLIQRLWELQTHISILRLCWSLKISLPTLYFTFLSSSDRQHMMLSKDGETNSSGLFCFFFYIERVYLLSFTRTITSLQYQVRSVVVKCKK